ncbi:deoxyribose-phosphate aldolase [Polaribacter pacificus]|uniref:Deoxyribose-phosphate aldolase n=1 Tax=Polaribacter pacificus TaxID=1775173 RepID=A0A917HWR3_9FLAO|nr:deoxyribose-phosphate aldolase [Polaribacter pacificus]GGG94374.1 deoxyribose-phosphate aldolase [Polaribacter pacificus]
MRLANYIDSTYLKTSSQAGVSSQETRNLVSALVNEAIEYQFKAVMIRSQFIPLAKNLIQEAKSKVLVGTVVCFHEGNCTVDEKLKEIKEALALGADEVDVVVNYKAFKNNQIALVSNELVQCTRLALESGKVIKWIIEVAALTTSEIAEISSLIKDLVLEKFSLAAVESVFVKSSTGFYHTVDGVPNGATFTSIRTMAENAKPLKIKAAGGIKTKGDLLKMITLGVDRIGTSSAKQLIEETKHSSNY